MHAFHRGAAMQVSASVEAGKQSRALHCGAVGEQLAGSLVVWYPIGERRCSTTSLLQMAPRQKVGQPCFAYCNLILKETGD